MSSPLLCRRLTEGIPDRRAWQFYRFRVVALPTTPSPPTLPVARECESCGEPIAFLHMPRGSRRNGEYRPVDPAPHPSGEYMLLADGRRSVSIYFEQVTDEFVDRFPPDRRFIDHELTCTPKGMHMLEHAARRAISQAALRPYEVERERRREMLKSVRPNN